MPPMLLRAALLALLSGCLSHSYTMDSRELSRLAGAAESDRASAHVRQRLVFSAAAQEADPATMLHDGLETAATAARRAVMAKALAAKANDAVGTDKPKRVEPANEESKPQDPAKEEQKRKEEKSDDSTAVVVVVVIAGSVFLGMALAGSEGDRYDGAVALPAEQPLHLRRGGREVGWVHAGALRPAMLGGIDEAIVTDDEGKLARLGRSRLLRRGFAYQVELGGAGMNTLSRDLSVGFLGRMAVGYFPAQSFGILAGAALQTGAKGTQAVASEVRPLLEAQLLPLRLGSFHPGLYVEGGYAIGSARVDVGDTRSTNSWAVGGGLLGQVDLTTFLALFGRAGVLALPDPQPTAIAPSLSLGIAIY